MNIKQIIFIVGVSAITTLSVVIMLILLFFLAPRSIWSVLTNDSLFTFVGISDVHDLTLSFLKDLWSYQSSMYEVLITSLVGINGIVAVIAFLYVGAKVKSDSEDAVKEYLNSEEFKKIWEERYREFAPDLEEYTQVVSKSVEDINNIYNGLEDVNKKIKIISENIARNDYAEEECSKLTIKKEL